MFVLDDYSVFLNK